jgi:hypothetical protein
MARSIKEGSGENWQVFGLKGTGSCDFSIENVFVSQDMTCPLMDVFLGNAVTGGPATRLGIPALVSPFHIGIPAGNCPSCAG